MGDFDNIRIPWTGWKVKEKLGEGGYGEVYKIERTQHGVEDCEALKIIRIPKNRQEYDSLIYSEGSEDKAKEKLSKQKDYIINEIEALTRLRGNGNVVNINGWSEEKLYDGYGWEIYIRMDALTPLKKYINGKKDQNLEEEEVIRLGMDICNALKQCEEENIVHRDIKPDNILVSPSGKFMLTDFGIAKILVEETTMTGAGTGWYMAPEVARYTKADKTVDLYSLGLVMYELLNNNRLPFLKTEGIVGALDRNAAKQRRLDGEDLPEPAHGSDELKRIVLKAAMADRSRRYKSAQDMFNDLEKLSGEMNDTEPAVQSPVVENRTRPFLDYILSTDGGDFRQCEIAAEQGQVSAQYNLGNYYYYGYSVEKNYEEAVKWYKLAAEQGDVLAQSRLGSCYEYGRGTEQDYGEAVKWYKLAAEQGDAFAQNNLGRCYEYGKDTEQDYEEAVKWYKLAAEQGKRDAQSNLERCNAKMEEVEKFEARKYEYDIEDLFLFGEEADDAKEDIYLDMDIVRDEPSFEVKAESETDADPVDTQSEVEALKRRYNELVGAPVEVITTEEAPSNDLSLEELEKDLFGEIPEDEVEETKKIDGTTLEPAPEDVSEVIPDSLIVANSPDVVADDNNESKASEKKKNRILPSVIFAVLLVAIGTFVFILTKPENNSEIKKAYDGFKTVATENGWEVSELDSYDRAFAHTYVNKSKGAEGFISFYVDLYKTEKDYDYAVEVWTSEETEDPASSNCYTNTVASSDGTEELNIIAFKDKMIIRATVYNTEEQEEVYSLLEALGIETPSAISGHYLEGPKTIDGWNCAVYELDKNIVNAEWVDIGIKLTNVEGDPKGSYKIMIRSDGSWDNYWSVDDIEESDKLYITRCNLDSELTVEALALVPDTAKPDKYSCQFKITGIKELPSD